ncbi:MAG TPA: DUF2934 domain-containing protein [Terriglobales bacterium]|nr:DUF2934 domain-containing protein [Terriglobales bacterium]
MEIKIKGKEYSRMSNDLGKKPKAAQTANPKNLEEEIRRRAYELYQSRAREDGKDVDDWLQAKSEVESKAGLQHKTTAA